ncbi:MAG TPA: twin transmembrane helix small protein [Pseudomonadales bacterium]|nr:twin transmembrane helix small protein [Pseudomonadales bacterium]
MWWAKLIILVLFVAAVISLFRALFFLVKDQGRSTKTVNSLAMRVGFCIALLLFLALAGKMGWITPHGVHPKDLRPAVPEAGPDTNPQPGAPAP